MTPPTRGRRIHYQRRNGNMMVYCDTCLYDKDCFQYKRNRISECIDKEYVLWESKKPNEFITKEEMEI